MKDVDFVDVLGMKVAWEHDGKIPEWGYSLNLPAGTPWNDRLSGVRNSTDLVPIIPFRSGDWFRSLAAVKAAGINKAVVTISPKSDVTVSSVRTAILVEEVKWAFIPIYKSGYSSFREFCYDNFNEFCGVERKVSHSLNSQKDMVGLKEYCKFSFVRDPLSRFRSFYKDKMMRAIGTNNDINFAQPIQILSDGRDPLSVSQFVACVPDSHSDPHWRSQRSTLFLGNECLVDKIIKLEEASSFLQEIWKSDEKPSFPQILATKKTLDEEIDWSSAYPFVKSRYSQDFDLLEP